MFQTEELKSEEFLPWCRGRGVDVWAMLQAASTGNLETIRKLVGKDPRLAGCEYQYLTPLRFAVRDDQMPVISFLLEHGANPMHEIGDSLLQVASDRGHAEIVEFLEALLRRRFGISPEGALLADAIKNFDLAHALTLLRERPELLHVADARGNQPIHWAVMTRQIQAIEDLLQRGADINARRPDGARPLDLTNGDYHYRGWRDLPATVLRKHEVVIGYLLARGADYDISMAAKLGDLKQIRFLLDRDPALVNRIPGYDTYYSGLPLRCAAAAGNYETVKLLLERGANPNEPEPGTAPQGGALHSAIGGKHFEIVKLLLENGADPNSAVESSGNCLWMAKHVGAPAEIVDLIASHGGALTAELVCYDGDVQTLATLLKLNPQLDFMGAMGTLMNQPRCMELALQHQPNLLTAPIAYETAWWDFGGPENAEFARSIMKRGLNPNRGNWLGATLLHRCAGRGNIEVASVCLDFGANINAVDTDACSTPLGWAAREGKTKMVEFLLSKGADSNSPADRPWALPVAWAKRRGHRQIVACLLAAQ